VCGEVTWARFAGLTHHVRFTDEQVLAEDFMDKVGEVAAVLRPFVRM
jgi:hypothetical protein